MKKNIKIIYDAFDGKLIGSKFMKGEVCEATSLLPEEIIDFVTQNCWFISSIPDAWAFAFTGNDLKDQHLIFLSDALLHQNPFQIRHSITHEIGHVILGHRNSVLVGQTKEEIKKQEKEAEDFAKKYTHYL